MAATAATRSINPTAPPTADQAPSVETSKQVSEKGEEAFSSLKAVASFQRITAHQKEIFTAMCSNINPEAMNSGAKITQAVSHILGISEVAAHAFEDRVNKIVQ